MTAYLDQLQQYQGDSDQVRLQNKESTLGARNMFMDLWSDSINIAGIAIGYHVHGYNLSTQDDFIYGEDITEPFQASKNINMRLEFQSDAILLSKFGIETNADVIATVSIKDYRNKFGINAEPKAGDVLELIESAWDITELPIYTDSITGETTGFDARTLLCRYKDASVVGSIMMELSALYGFKYVRHPQLFEVTEVKYQDFTQPGMNVLQGHYVWKLHAKRFDYSFEYGLSGENPTQSVYDNSFFGALSSVSGSATPDKAYTQNVDTAGNQIWNYEERGTDTSPYGYY